MRDALAAADRGAIAIDRQFLGRPSIEERAADTAAGWPDPIKLPDLPAVEPFDNALLPDSLRPWASDIADRVQCAPDFVAASVMAALGAVVGRRVGVRPQALTDWSEVPNQWALLIGRPGILKSPAMEAALAPLKCLAAKAAEAHEAQLATYEAERAAAELRREARKTEARQRLRANPSGEIGDLGVPDPAAPFLQRFISNDSTAAALGELLRQNPNGLLVHRDEIVSLLRSLDREDNAEARGFYLTAWNGTSAYTLDRIGRGMNLHIPAVCISLLGSTQPARIAEYVRAAVTGTTADDGLIQRFGLMVWPASSGEWRNVDRLPDNDAKRAAFAQFERLAHLDPLAIGATQDRGYSGEAEGVPFLRFTDPAREAFEAWRVQLEGRLRSGDLHPALESHLSKYRKLIPTLALLLHLADSGTGGIGEAALLRALAWGSYLESHARRVYASVTSPEIEAAKAIIRKLRAGALSRQFSSRDVWRPGWTGLTDRGQVAAALATLDDYGWLRAFTEQTGGRARTVYEAHPKVAL